MAAYDLKDDGELIALLVAGDRSAFTEIFNRYNKLLYSHVLNKIRDEDAAEDLVQDIFVVLWEKRSLVKNINLSGYLFTMTRNRILNMLSHSKIVSDYASTIKNYEQPSYPKTDELIREKQLSAIIESEINALPPRMREVFVLSRYKHLSNKEIAARLGLSEHTVADQIKKSLKTLRFRIGVRILITCTLTF
ncbi:RNA polymerase sigma-70 factor [Sphingobacterium alkalisoli]|uniref:RNA polymerase sigma-70 factor n=1 Tax=Sphingobacterium alkalisoli TaxID=1874115 RepID=A0A4U0GML1_9SPHI|nr:RNA polymerase sigma-70 factor [Sphingobacterium alkalisoli]TJY60080.1 RNA polymerase sigma-70 factor [Sphingobacterium alkalisoli]GGH32765.1 DNA-directed RNA polymerase sigma-70 factor [Sphingobacterium alkalisoli]